MTGIPFANKTILMLFSLNTEPFTIQNIAVKPKVKVEADKEKLLFNHRNECAGKRRRNRNSNII